MIEEKRKIEFWNYLTTERNQPRPRGITVQRLAVIKSKVFASDLWSRVVEPSGGLPAREFYQSEEAAVRESRGQFWEAVSAVIV